MYISNSKILQTESANIMLYFSDPMSHAFFYTLRSQTDAPVNGILELFFVSSISHEIIISYCTHAHSS